MKIGFFGGYFNPPSNIHINIAKTILNKYKLNKVVFVPVGNYYEKKDSTDEKHRYNMLKLATKDEDKLEVENILLNSKQTLYAIDTFSLLSKKYKNNELFFIMGSDNFRKMPTWKEYEMLINTYNFIIIERERKEIRLDNRKNVFAYIPEKLEEMDSTKIRNIIKNGQETKEILNQRVYDYIKENKLYIEKNENKIENILKEASECLNCKKPLCRTGCPIATNIPQFISHIKNRNFEEAYNVLHENNIMSEICGKVCPSENQCMGKCVKGLKGKPVNINKLENFINNWAIENDIEYKYKKEDKKQANIAIIGSGPAGISCAVELLKKGYKVTIFEKESKAGGILKYGIPDFRLEKASVDRVIENLEDLGAKIEYNTEFGKDIKLENLKNFDAIFLSFGANIPLRYELTKENTDNIWNANDFLKTYNKGEKIKNLGQVVVIGGGNVAMDSARTAKRLGAEEVTIAYRRDKTQMPASKKEIEETIQDGVKILYNTKVINAKMNNEKLKKVRCIKTEIENGKVIDIENSEFEIEADTVIFAIGLGIDEKMLNNLRIETENGLIKVDENNMTSIKGFFAGGDLIEKRSTVAKAIASGKKTAKTIIEYICNF